MTFISMGHLVTLSKRWYISDGNLYVEVQTKGIFGFFKDKYFADVDFLYEIQECHNA